MKDRMDEKQIFLFRTIASQKKSRSMEDEWTNLTFIHLNVN